ncbi:hypothetical protein ACWD33_07790 [Streptomyces xiamenensis]
MTDLTNGPPPPPEPEPEPRPTPPTPLPGAVRALRVLLWIQTGYAALAILLLTSQVRPVDGALTLTLALLALSGLMAGLLAAGPVVLGGPWTRWVLVASALLGLVAALAGLTHEQAVPQHGIIPALVSSALLLLPWAPTAESWYGRGDPDREPQSPPAADPRWVEWQARRAGVCASCEAGPVADRQLHAVKGFLLFHATTRSPAPLCRDCGLAHYRRHTLRTLGQGWWGFVSFPLTVVALVRNLAAYLTYRRLPAPPPHPERDVAPRRAGLVAVGSVLLIAVMVTALAAGIRYAAAEADRQRDQPPSPTAPPGPGTTVPGSGTDLDDNLGRLDDLNGAGEG